MKKIALSRIVRALLVFILLYFLYNYNFLVYHSIVELFSIIIAFNIFIIGWNSRNFTNNSMLLLLGIAYFSVGLMDGLHMLTFEGVEIFRGINANTAIQFWLIGRYLESVSLFVAGIVSLKKLNIKMEYIFVFYFIISFLAILCVIRYRLFPVCFIPEDGLTTFKIYSEYLISGICILTGIIFWKYRAKINIDLKAIYYLVISLIMTGIAEIYFTLYEQFTGYPQFMGHIFKLFSFYLIYKALSEESLKKPYSNLFKDYNSTQKKLIATGSLMSTMLHDIKNPLTNIRALSQIGEKRSSSARDKKYYQKIIQYVDNITGMINKINQAFDSSNMKKFNPARLLEEVASEMHVLCHSNDVQLEVNYGNIKGQVLLEKRLFKRVIYNIVKNAVQILDRGGLITIDMEDQKKFIKISISDNGPGISPEIQDEIFKPYTTGGGGTGLGLYMVDFAVTDVFGGRVWFDSEQDRGTTFYILLPKVSSATGNTLNFLHGNYSAGND